MRRLLYRLLLGLALTAQGWCASVPSQLKILGETWRVIVVKKLMMAGETYYGSTNCFLHTITVRKGSDSDMADTVWHEIFHAITCENGDVHNERFNNLTDEHTGIYFAAPRSLRVLQDNPDLLKFFRQTAPSTDPLPPFVIPPRGRPCWLGECR